MHTEYNSANKKIVATAPQDVWKTESHLQH